MFELVWNMITAHKKATVLTVNIIYNVFHYIIALVTFYYHSIFWKEKVFSGLGDGHHHLNDAIRHRGRGQSSPQGRGMLAEWTYAAILKRPETAMEAASVLTDRSWGGGCLSEDAVCDQHWAAAYSDPLRRSGN